LSNCPKEAFMRATDHERLLVKAARLYYEQELTQSQISKRLRLSRQKVQRLLQEARQEGIVQISIRPVMGIFTDLERALEQVYNLREAIVVETTDYGEHDTVTREIGMAAAEYLLRVIQPGDAITISWGSTLLGMVNALYATAVRIDIDGLTVVQALGGLGDPTDEVHAADLTRRLARILGGQAVLLPAPGAAGTLAAREALMGDPHVQRALEQASQANLAVMGIGAPRPDSVLIQHGSIIQWEELAALQEQGAVGDINLRYFDEDGQPMDSDLDRRIIGLTLEDIQQIETVVGIAGGDAKFNAIQGAVSGQLVDVLVTDDVTAHRLLEQA
jgi:DNA-binding transcriptional regulator LsrR (DeoR family)